MTPSGVLETRHGRVLELEMSNPAARNALLAETSQKLTRALRLEGTCSGEHGVGLHKMDFLLSEAGSGAVAMMRTIKQALDPHNIMNPGKILAL